MKLLRYPSLSLSSYCYNAQLLTTSVAGTALVCAGPTTRTFCLNASLRPLDHEDPHNQQPEQQVLHLRSPQHETSILHHPHELLPTFDNLNQLFHYAEVNASTLPSSSLAQLAGRLKDIVEQEAIHQQSEDSKSLNEHPSLQMLMSTIAESLTRMNVRDCLSILQSLSRIKQRLPVGSTLVNDTGTPLLKRLGQRELDVEPDQEAQLLYWLIQAGVADLSLSRYMRDHIPTLCGQLSLSGVRTMLRALHQFGLKDPQLLNPLSDRLTNEIDRFDNEDVVDTFRLDFETNMVNRPCYLKLTDILTRHYQLFTTNELSEMFHLAAALHCLNPVTSRSIVQHLQSRLDGLNEQQILQVLVGLMQLGERYYDVASPFFNALLVKCPISELTPDQALKMLYAICHYEVKECGTELENLLTHYIAHLPSIVPKDHLAMLSEITVAVENEFEDLTEIRIPEDLRQLVDRHALSVTVNWKISKNVLQLQSKLPESHRCQFEPDVVVGPYVASFVDESQKLILEVNTPRAPIGIEMKKRHFERLGYTVLRLSGKAMLHTRNPDALLEILTRAIDKHAVETGKTSQGDILARKDFYQRT